MDTYKELSHELDETVDTVVKKNAPKLDAKALLKKALPLGVTVALVAVAHGLYSGTADVPAEYVPGELIVKFDDEVTVRYDAQGDAVTGFSEVDSLNEILSGESYRQLAAHPGEQQVDMLYVVDVDDSLDLEEWVERFNAAEGVEFADFNWLDTFPDEPSEQQASLYLTARAGGVTPNDRYFGTRGSWGQDFLDMWGLHASNAQQAWEITRGSDDVIIAVIDTGVDYTHPDLAGRVLQGYDFANRDTDAMDDHGHGSHVAGTIAAATDNELGVAGINWEGKILPIKVCNAGGSCPRSAILEGIVYAADHDADVINMSLGGPGGPQSYDAAIRYADSRGVIIVVAAGNNNEDTAGFTPANHPLVIAVAALGPDGNRTSFSNWGAKVDVGAPGQGILSTVPQRHNIPTSRYRCLQAEDGIHNYCELAGTSMASPHVAGEVALILAANPELRGQREEVREIVRAAITPYDRPQDRPVGTGRMNLLRAVELAREHGE